MSIFKWLAGVVAGLVIVIILAVLLIPMFVDPNDYRQDITALVKDNTGRDLALAGDLKISVFPWLGIKTEGLSMSQPAQIGGDMVSVKTAQLRLKLMPLLGKRLEIDTIVLDQPTLNIVTLQDGTSSFSGLAGEEAPSETAKGAEPNAAGSNSTNTPEPPSEKEADASAAVALVVQGVKITNANVLWDDRQAGQKYAVNDFNLTTGNLLGGSFAPVEMSGVIVDSAEPTPIQLALTGQAKIDADTLVLTMQELDSEITQGAQNMQLGFSGMTFDQNSALKLDGLKLAADVVIPAAEGEGTDEPQSASLNATLSDLEFQFVGEPGQLSVSQLLVNANFQGRPFKLDIPAVTANMEKQTANVASIKVTSKDMNLSLSDLNVSDFIDNPVARGQLNLTPFSVAELLKDLAIDYVPSNASALQAVGLSLDFSGGMQSAELKNLAVKLDQSNLTGNVAINNFETLATEFALVLDNLNLDDYLPAATGEESAAGEPAVEGAEALAVPLAAMQDLNVNGTFEAGQLVSGGLKLTDVNVAIASADGVLTVTPKVSLYDGKLDGVISFDESSETKTLKVDNQIDLVSLGNMLIDADVTDQLSGLGSLDIDVTVTETNGVQSNEGVIKLLAKNGAVKGIDIKGMIDSAYGTIAKLTGQDQGNQDGQGASSDETRFAELLGTFYLKDNVLTNNDFSMKAPLFRVSGEGVIDVAKESINYLVSIAVVGTTDGQGGAAIDELAGITIPVRLKGDLSAPGYSLDMKELYKALAKRELRLKKDKLLGSKLGIDLGLGGGSKEEKEDKREKRKKLLQGLFK